VNEKDKAPASLASTRNVFWNSATTASSSQLPLLCPELTRGPDHYVHPGKPSQDCRSRPLQMVCPAPDEAPSSTTIMVSLSTCNFVTGTIVPTPFACNSLTVHLVLVGQHHLLYLLREKVDRPLVIDHDQLEQVLSADCCLVLSLSDSAWALLSAFLRPSSSKQEAPSFRSNSLILASDVFILRSYFPCHRMPVS
jgi:hypothetical protein